MQRLSVIFLFIFICSLLLEFSSKLLAEETKVSPPSPNMLSQENFEKIETLPALKIQESELKREFAHTNLDNLWETVVDIFAQKTLILHVSKESRIIVAINSPIPLIPFSVYIKDTGNEGRFELYFYPMRNLYSHKKSNEQSIVEDDSFMNSKRVQEIKNENSLVIEPKQEKELAEFLFDRIAAQLYVSEVLKW